MKKTIFIHIPKTGGTSINAAMQGSAWQTEPNFFYRHIKLKDKRSNAGDIFLPKNMEKYQAYNIFMMLRHPVDRTISEYFFIKERKNFMDLLQKKPTNFKSYIKNTQTQNGVVNFLKGRSFFGRQIATQNDVESIMDAIEDLPIHVGIFEHFAQSLDYFTSISQLDLKKEMEVKRITFKRPNMNEIGEEMQELILEKNDLDWQLYQFALDKFESIKGQYRNDQFTFNKDKYNHVIPYARQCCFFEFSMENKRFLQQHKLFFRDLTLYLLQDKAIQDGKLFNVLWNNSFVNAISSNFPNSGLDHELQQIALSDEKPLEDTFTISAIVDRILSAKNTNSNQYMKPIYFSSSLVPTIEKPKKKSGFFRNLFKK